MRNHAMGGVLQQMQSEGVPEEVVRGIQKHWTVILNLREKQLQFRKCTCFCA